MKPSLTSQSPESVRGRLRRRLVVRGRVQGVGFRPFVYRLACEENLAGCVLNNSLGVVIELEGEVDSQRRFVERLRSELPEAARITGLEVSDLDLAGDADFRILPSVRGEAQRAEIAPDLATCPDCLRELLDPGDGRYRYPFINCTNCGPRYSIVQSVPYDRSGTTMSAFEMCEACLGEYEDPADRRFHAQPNACPECGPRVWLTDAEGRVLEGDPFKEAGGLLRSGKIVAVKGLGGFHLACRADDDGAVGRLRERKGREAKPFAVMVRDLAAAGRLVCFDEGDAIGEALCSAARPIVLAPRRGDAGVSDLVAPGAACLGAMLAYTPLHHLLFAEYAGPLVMTSGNPSDEPLCSENEEALRRLRDLADAFLLHDREIERRVDDSVVIAMDLPEGRSLTPLRRARGYVPEPIQTPFASREAVLALGGEMKGAVCILSEDQATLSEHLGELSNPEAYRNFLGAIHQFEKLLRVRPGVIAHDLHPDYMSTRHARNLARERGCRLEGVQHNHAHVASCMAENGVSERVVGVVCDGTGYGT
ncbi:carbamoyltransferase HypF, partial [bacterium]|nr:carbamoyltransferase HypF [bacterium]